MGDLIKKLGLRIKELREKQGYTQLNLAEVLDMEASNLSKIERGIQMPKEESLIKIAKALKVNVVDLFDFEYFNNETELRNCIIDKINNSSLNELRKIYKILINL